MRNDNKHVNGTQGFVGKIIQPEYPITASPARKRVIAVAPEVPCDECLRAQGVIRGDGSVRVYCAHHRCGAVFDGHVWTVYSPMPERGWSEMFKQDHESDTRL